MPKSTLKQSPDVVRELYAGVQKLLRTKSQGRPPVGQCKHGVYLFRDYDDEPIYVGQTSEKIGSRIRRHLTNQRTDAVAMRVLDPFEVADVEIWPFWEIQDLSAKNPRAKSIMRKAEFAVYCHAIQSSQFDAILNEKDIPAEERIELPQSVRGSILTDLVRKNREHSDIRVARRAQTIAELARIISERDPSPGLRRTLLTQARRLEVLAARRLQDFEGTQA